MTVISIQCIHVLLCVYCRLFLWNSSWLNMLQLSWNMIAIGEAKDTLSAIPWVMLDPFVHKPHFSLTIHIAGDLPPKKWRVYWELDLPVPIHHSFPSKPPHSWLSKPQWSMPYRRRQLGLTWISSPGSSPQSQYRWMRIDSGDNQRTATIMLRWMNGSTSKDPLFALWRVIHFHWLEEQFKKKDD